MLMKLLKRLSFFVYGFSFITCINLTNLNRNNRGE